MKILIVVLLVLLQTKPTPPADQVSPPTLTKFKVYTPIVVRK